ncbi:hypothetical protein scyTo_0004658 [Scyliorhinus torazame]|uniref:Uncharacterized protein n=2 Tax=Scyliorhinus torazame TaxID=75743 RepID=A0A401NV81_SCYTO|nr:hypothetical protein [Scyliorhinus torazame]
MGSRLGSVYFLLSIVLQLVLFFNEAGATGMKCSHIYKGFAECLLKLGDSLAKNIEGETEEVKELDTVCR